jgi:hypothetical protein
MPPALTGLRRRGNGRSIRGCLLLYFQPEVRIAGADAETGTEPDSAPQYPLKTSGVSPVATIFVNDAKGVPTMSTPHQFIRPAIREDLEPPAVPPGMLRLSPPGQRESTSDVVDQQPIRLIFVDQLDELGPSIVRLSASCCSVPADYPAKPVSRPTAAVHVHCHAETPRWASAIFRNLLGTFIHQR